MDYPKIIKLKNEKLKKLLTEKAELVTLGRGKSDEIVELEKQMDDLDKQIQEEEKKVDISDLDEKARVITEKVNEAIKEMDVVKQEIYSRMKTQVSNDLSEKYEAIKKQKDEAETDRNKLALKAQKYNHKLIPLGRKLMKPFLENKYDDYETIQIDNGEIVATIFNHLNDFEINFNKKKQ